MLQSSEVLLQRINELAHGRPSPQEREQLQRYLEQFATTYGYSGVVVVHHDGRTLMRVGENVQSSSAMEQMLQTMQPGKVQRSSIYRDSFNRPRIEWLVPLGPTQMDAGRPAAAIIFHVDAEQSIFKLIQTWPTASPSGETLLVGASGEAVQFINTLRHREKTAAELALSINTPNLPAAVAIRTNAPGIAAGLDYRQVAVFSAFRPVSGTPWHIVAKLDKDEVFAPLHTLVTWIVAVAFSTVFALCAGLYLLWRQHQRVLYLATLAHRAQETLERNALDESVRASQARAQMLVDASLDAIVTIDESGAIIAWNAQAEPIFGHAAEDAMGRDMADLIVPPALRQAHRDGMARYLQTGDVHIIGKRVEVQGLRADGSEFPMELSISKMYQGGQYFFTAYIRDISARKRAEQDVRWSLELMTLVFNASPIAACITTLDEGRFLQVNPNCERDFGWTNNDLIGKTSAALGLWPDEQDYRNWVQTLRTAQRLIGYDAIHALEAARASAYIRPQRTPAVEPPVPYPEDTLSYLANVYNEKARDFYARHGVKVVEAAYESHEELGEVSLMITKHCVRFSLSLCPKQAKGVIGVQGTVKAKPLTLINGKEKLTLRFDCKPCEMHVVGRMRKSILHAAPSSETGAPVRFYRSRPLS